MDLSARVRAVCDLDVSEVREYAGRHEYDGKPQDLSGYQGVRLRVKVTKGILCVQVGSSEIQNYDYHTSAPIAGTRGEFQEVLIPFKQLKRGWSEQTVLNLKSITSVNLVSFGLAKDTFAYEVKEIGFY